MPSYVTLQTLVNRTLQRSNLEGAMDSSNSGTKFCTLAEVTDLINESLKTELYGLLVQYVGENYFRTTTPFTFFTNRGQTLYACPQDCYQLLSVDVWLGGNYPVSSRRYYEQQRNVLRAFPFGWNYQFPEFYQLQGSGAMQSVNFLGAPNAAFQVDLNYIKSCPTLVNLTDVWDDINGWSEVAVLEAASRLLIKDGQLDVAQYLDARKERLLQQIRAAAPNRHAGEPEVVSMIANRTETNGGWLE